MSFRKTLVKGFLSALLLLGLPLAAHAQTAKVVSACGSPPVMLPVGQVTYPTLDTNGNLCTGASITPSGTQDVNVKQIGGTTTLTGAGATGAGSLRDTVAQDTTTIAGSAPGTAGTPSTNVVSVQGVAAGTVLPVGGNIASGAADSGNPVKAGAVYKSTQPTFTDGQRGDLQIDSRGDLRTANCNNTNCQTVAAIISGIGTTNAAGMVLAIPSLYNGATLDLGYYCPNQASVSVTAGNTTQIVALSGSTKVHICSAHLGISLTGSFAFTSGTGTNCGTPANALAAIPLTTGTPYVDNGPTGSAIYTGSAGGEFCVTATIGNVTGWVTYVQF